MSAIDEYLVKARDALITDDSGRIDSVAREIISAFHSEIPHIANYRGSTIGGHGNHTKANLKQLMGKLLVLRDEKDAALYGNYGLITITDNIRKLEDALLSIRDDDQLIAIYREVDGVYANTIDAYTTGLSGWSYWEYEANDEQTKLRISKLRDFRDSELRRIRIAESQAGKIDISQSQTQTASATATSIAIVDVLEACKQVDELPEDSLSEADKTFLKGMMLELEMAANGSNDKGKEKLSKILGFLADKGVDVLIAAWPFLWTTMQSMMG